MPLLLPRRAFASTLFVAFALGGILGLSLQPPARAVPSKLPVERFIAADALNALALGLPAPSDEVTPFEREVALLLKNRAADWPRAAERANENAPNHAYTTGGLCYLTLLDEVLADEVGRVPELDDKAAACRARYPATCALLERAARDLVTSKYKPFPRPRPTGDRHDSYPSGHTAQAALECRLLWEIVREKRPEAEDVLLREACARAFDRVVLAVHHPTDVTAGVAFGFAAAGLIIQSDSDQVRAALEAARAEW